MEMRGNNDELESCALTVFARAPVPGRVKTRLIPQVGEISAGALYTAMLRDTLDLAARVAHNRGACETFIAYTPSNAFDDTPHSLIPLWNGEGRLVQQGADLGARMLHCFADLRAQGYARVVIIGSDAPDIPEALLQDAFDALGLAPVVLGPASDGGYYLIGTSVAVPLDAFEGIAWSTATALAATRQALARHGIGSQLLLPWNDVDTFEDLTALAARLARGESHAAATSAWLRASQLL